MFLTLSCDCELLKGRGYESFLSEGSDVEPSYAGQMIREGDPGGSEELLEVNRCSYLSGQGNCFQNPTGFSGRHLLQ